MVTFGREIRVKRKVQLRMVGMSLVQQEFGKVLDKIYAYVLFMSSKFCANLVDVEISSKSLKFVLWARWISVRNFMEIHQIIKLFHIKQKMSMSWWCLINKEIKKRAEDHQSQKVSSTINICTTFHPITVEIQSRPKWSI